MNLKIIDKDCNELKLIKPDNDYLLEKISCIEPILSNDEIFIIPTHDFSGGIIFNKEQYKNNEASHYTFDDGSFSISDSNNKFSALLSEKYSTNYSDFIRYFKDICEIQPIFLKNKVDMSNIHLEWNQNPEMSILHIRYFLSENNSKTINSCSFRIPFDLILNAEKESYRYIFLNTIYRNHLFEFKNEHTLDDFLINAEDIFAYRRLLEY